MIAVGVGQGRTLLHQADDRPEGHLTGRTDGLEGPLSIFDARQLHDDRPLALNGDLRLLDGSKAFDAASHDLDGRVEGVGIGALRPHECHREAALQIEPQLGRPSGEQHGAERPPRDGEGDDQRDDRGLAVHYESSPTRSAIARFAMRMLEPPPMSSVKLSSSSDRTVP